MYQRVDPKAVVRQLLTALDEQYQPLTSGEEARLLSCVETCPDVPNAVGRLLAQLSRNTLGVILDKI